MIRAANRILDACMASHPLFLVYLQLALYENFSKKDGIMDQVEDAITLTIAYMYVLSASTFLKFTYVPFLYGAFLNPLFL